MLIGSELISKAMNIDEMERVLRMGLGLDNSVEIFEDTKLSELTERLYIAHVFAHAGIPFQKYFVGEGRLNPGMKSELMLMGQDICKQGRKYDGSGLCSLAQCQTIDEFKNSITVQNLLDIHNYEVRN